MSDISILRTLEQSFRNSEKNIVNQHLYLRHYPDSFGRNDLIDEMLPLSQKICNNWDFASNAAGVAQAQISYLIDTSTVASNGVVANYSNNSNTVQTLNLLSNSYHNNNSKVR
jgi:hypothetical protein